jgi:hypothetical protein
MLFFTTLCPHAARYGDGGEVNVMPVDAMKDA